MTAPSIDADFGSLFNQPPRESAWARRDVNGRRDGFPFQPARPGPRHAAPAWQVLFISGSGIARSWMAATLLAHYGGRYAQAGFDGPVPDAVPLTVATAMREICLAPQDGPAIPGAALSRAPDLLITMGLTGVRPESPHTRVRSWNISDPVGQPIDTVRAVRDTIAHKVRLLTRELQTGP